MAKDRFADQSEKLSAARSALMLPHAMGEAYGLTGAFHACSVAFHNFDMNRVKDENARHWIATITRLMDTEWVEGPTAYDTWLHRARLMTEEEKQEFSNAVDQLASWFNREFWSNIETPGEKS